MLRLEVEPASGRFLILVRAVHATVASGIRHVLSAQLGGGAGGAAGAGAVDAGGVGA